MSLNLTIFIHLGLLWHLQVDVGSPFRAVEQNVPFWLYAVVKMYY